MKLEAFLKFVIAGLLLVFSNVGLQLRAQDNSGGYVFQGITFSARSGQSYYPVVAVDKKRIHVDLGTKTKKVGLQAPCMAQSTMRVSSKFVEVLELGVFTSSLSNLQRASDAVADMQRAEIQSETHAAIVSSRAGGTSGNANRAAAEQIRSIKETNQEFQSGMQEGLDSRAFEQTGVADAVFLDLEISPQSDIEGAFCVFTVNYLVKNIDTGRTIGKRRVARIKYLGDLKRGEIFRFKKRFGFNEFLLDTAEHSIHIFSKDGEEIAMSDSRGLKALSRDDFETIQNALAK